MMSHTEPLQSPCVGEDTAVSGDDSLRNTVNSPDGSERERVLKEVGLTSTTFIGPEFPPEKTSIKPDVEDTLSEFYKELEKVDAPEGAYGYSGKQGDAFIPPPTPPTASDSGQTRDVSQEKPGAGGKSAKTESCWKSSGQRPSWPRWYQNGPYCPGRPRPDLTSDRAESYQNQWPYPQPQNRPTRPYRPQYHHPPPPFAFPHPQTPPATFPASSRFLPPNVYIPRTQDCYGDKPHRFDWDDRRGAFSNQREFGHFGAGEEQRSRFDDYDRQHGFIPENKLWGQHDHYRPHENTQAYESSLVLIMMRGLPGSGKSTLARELLFTRPNGLILSTDDYFAYMNEYRYDPSLVGVAHEWNQARAEDAMRNGRSPIIIDNTNIQAWEMKPYVRMALERGYKIDFCEPNTSWKLDPFELEKRNKHGVSQEKIAKMLDRFSSPISVDIVMSSQEPRHVTHRHPEQQHKTRRSNRDRP